MAECSCTLHYKHYVSLPVNPPYTERTIASYTAPLSLGINNSIHLQLFTFYANLISETNLFGMAVCAIDLKAPVGNLDQDCGFKTHSFIKEQTVKHHCFHFHGMKR